MEKGESVYFLTFEKEVFLIDKIKEDRNQLREENKFYFIM